jgi:hypothetical protein
VRAIDLRLAELTGLSEHRCAAWLPTNPSSAAGSELAMTPLRHAASCADA